MARDRDTIPVPHAGGAMAYLADRFRRAPNLTGCHAVHDRLCIRYDDKDAARLPAFGEICRVGAKRALAWFGLDAGPCFEIWLAGDPADLFFMTALRCQGFAAYAPGQRDGKAIIIVQVPRPVGLEKEHDRLVAIVAHECAHHIVEGISGASVYTMRRRQENDLPMWVEEGLCVVVQAACRKAALGFCTKDGPAAASRYAISALWNDLSDCPDRDAAYAQAYAMVRAVIGTYGKDFLLWLLRRDRFRAYGGGALFNVLARRQKSLSGL